MKTKGQKCVLKRFSLEDSDINAHFDVNFIQATFARELTERLARKGIEVIEHRNGSTGPEILENSILLEGRFLKVDEGDHSRRFFSLLGGKCCIELEGQVRFSDDAEVRSYKVKCEQGEGFLGGTDSRDLLDFSARLCAAQAARHVIKSIKKK